MIKNISLKIRNIFGGRLPDFQSILGLYAIITFAVYSWTIFISFYKLPSWVFYLTIPQIVSVYAYAFTANLIESFIVLMCLLILHYTLFIPFRNGKEFQTRSTLFSLAVLASAICG